MLNISSIYKLNKLDVRYSFMKVITHLLSSNLKENAGKWKAETCIIFPGVVPLAKLDLKLWSLHPK